MIANRGKSNYSRNCTPGYYNFEGQFQRRQDGNYNGGILKYYQHIHNVEEHFDEHFQVY